MRRLSVYDFDGTLINTFSPEEGKPMWEKYYGKKFEHKGWWGRPESLDTEVFDIKPFPNVLAKLQEDMADPNTTTIILTSRMEKLRSQLENILKLNGIKVDELITKNGADDKGDVILKIERYNKDLKEIVVYDDFAGMMPDKIVEYTKIRDKLPADIQYNIFRVNNNEITLLEAENKLLNIIKEEIQDFTTERLSEPIYIYHGADINNLMRFIANPTILPPEEKMKLPSNTGGYLIGMSTSTDINNARKYSTSFGHHKVLKLILTQGAKVIYVDTQDNGIDNIFTGDELENLQKNGIDAIIETDDYAEKEVRILNPNHLSIVGVV